MIKNEHKVEIFGVDIVELYDFDIEKSYKFLKDKTNYLNNISKNDIKKIMYSYHKEVYILLKDGSLYKDGIKIMNNIIALCFISGLSIYAIDKDKIIYPLGNNTRYEKFINNNNYKYKKIIFDDLRIVALTYENTIKVIGLLVDEIIDYERYTNVNDIGYIEENDDIVIIKNNKIISLFCEYDYSSNDINVKLDEGSNKYMII